jgi:hypothetical protein
MSQKSELPRVVKTIILPFISPFNKNFIGGAGLMNAMTIAVGTQ